MWAINHLVLFTTRLFVQQLVRITPTNTSKFRINGAVLRGSPANDRFPVETLRWRHNGCDNIPNHQPHDCLLNRLFRRRSKKTSSSASLAFVWEIHRGPVSSPDKWPVTRKIFPFDDVIMKCGRRSVSWRCHNTFHCCGIGFPTDYCLMIFNSSMN